MKDGGPGGLVAGGAAPVGSGGGLMTAVAAPFCVAVLGVEVVDLEFLARQDECPGADLACVAGNGGRGRGLTGIFEPESNSGGEGGVELQAGGDLADRCWCRRLPKNSVNPYRTRGGWSVPWRLPNSRPRSTPLAQPMFRVCSW